MKPSPDYRKSDLAHCGQAFKQICGKEYQYDIYKVFSDLVAAPSVGSF